MSTPATADPKGRMLSADEFNWFVGVTDELARDALEKLRRTGYAQHWLFFKPHGLAFAVVGPGEIAPAAFVKACEDSIPVVMGRHALRSWLRARCQTLPMFPV